MRISQQRVAAVMKVSLAVGLILLGIMGLLLPIIPGWALIILGLVVLGVIERKHADEAKRWLHEKKRRATSWFRKD